MILLCSLLQEDFLFQEGFSSKKISPSENISSSEKIPPSEKISFQEDFSDQDILFLSQSPFTFTIRLLLRVDFSHVASQVDLQIYFIQDQLISLWCLSKRWERPLWSFVPLYRPLNVVPLQRLRNPHYLSAPPRTIPASCVTWNTAFIACITGKTTFITRMSTCIIWNAAFVTCIT